MSVQREMECGHSPLASIAHSIPVAGMRKTDAADWFQKRSVGSQLGHLVRRAGGAGLDDSGSHAKAIGQLAGRKECCMQNAVRNFAG